MFPSFSELQEERNQILNNLSKPLWHWQQTNDRGNREIAIDLLIRKFMEKTGLPIEKIVLNIKQKYVSDGILEEIWLSEKENQ
jgi:hypothetical protein